MIKIIGLEDGKKIITDLPTSEIKNFVEKKHNLIWIDIENPSEEDYKFLSEDFAFHPLEIEDCKRMQELPKIDEFEDHLFMVFHRISYDFKKRALKTQEFDVFLSSNYIITFHMEPSEMIRDIQERCIKEKRVLARGVDFMLHHIIDNVVDEYFPVLDYWDDKIEKLESEVLKGKTKKSLQHMLKFKRDIRNFKKSIEPQRDIISKISNMDLPFISEKANIYFNDVYDHTIRAYSILEDQRDTLTSIFEAHLSIVSNKMNEIMKTLTIIATIFIPLTFVVGIYGMNFKYMPELEWPLGYYLVWAVMISATIIMIIYFIKKGWISFKLRGNSKKSNVNGKKGRNGK
jgi:magnesium transporter